MSDLKNDIKQLIIDALGLEDISVSDIGDDQTLFGDGLGLDSVDALELGLAIQKTYGIKIDADAKDTRNHFSNVASLAALHLRRVLGDSSGDAIRAEPARLGHVGGNHPIQPREVGGLAVTLHQALCLLAVFVAGVTRPAVAGRFVALPVSDTNLQRQTKCRC
mgnify:CR=1 FL=1